MVIPQSHHVTGLIIHRYHNQNLHMGAQQIILYHIREKYWLLNGRNQTRKIIRNCIRCFRAAPLTTKYFIEDLSAIRINEAPPFTNVAIDYCGPFHIKEKRIRNKGCIKVYVAVFIYLAIRAVYLELNSDLSTEAFIAILKKFIHFQRKMQDDLFR